MTNILDFVRDKLHIYPFKAIWKLDSFPTLSESDKFGIRRSWFLRNFERTFLLSGCFCGTKKEHNGKHAEGCPFGDLMNAGLSSPFVMWFPNKREVADENGMEIEFALIGERIRHLPFVLLAFHEMKLSGTWLETGKMSLDEVWLLDENRIPIEQVYSGKDGVLRQELIQPISFRSLEMDQTVQVTRLDIWFVHPVRLETNNGISVIPEFTLVADCLWRRLCALMAVTSKDGEVPPFPEFSENRSNMVLVKSKVRWIEKNWTVGDSLSYPVGGIVGTATYTGELNAYLPLLKIGEWIGTGHGPYYEFGQILIFPSS